MRRRRDTCLVQQREAFLGRQGVERGVVEAPRLFRRHPFEARGAHVLVCGLHRTLRPNSNARSVVARSPTNLGLVCAGFAKGCDVPTSCSDRQVKPRGGCCCWRWCCCVLHIPAASAHSSIGRALPHLPDALSAVIAAVGRLEDQPQQLLPATVLGGVEHVLQQPAAGESAITTAAGAGRLRLRRATTGTGTDWYSISYLFQNLPVPHDVTRPRAGSRTADSGARGWSRD